MLSRAPRPRCCCGNVLNRPAPNAEGSSPLDWRLSMSVAMGEDIDALPEQIKNRSGQGLWFGRGYGVAEFGIIGGDPVEPARSGNVPDASIELRLELRVALADAGAYAFAQHLGIGDARLVLAARLAAFGLEETAHHRR